MLEDIRILHILCHRLVLREEKVKEEGTNEELRKILKKQKQASNIYRGEFPCKFFCGKKSSFILFLNSWTKEELIEMIIKRKYSHMEATQT